MDIEFEAKFYPVDREKFRELLHSLGAVLVVPERKLKRVIFNIRDNPQFLAEIFRVRDEGKGIVRLSAKNTAKDGGKLTDQKEVDVEVSDFDKTMEILKLAGLKTKEYIENMREEWSYKGAEIDIDSWPGLEPYVEIEAESEEEVRSLAEELGLSWEGKIITPAVEIYAKLYGLTVNEVLKNYEHLTFENNPFAGLTRRSWQDIIKNNK